MSAIALVIAIAMPIALILGGMVFYGRHQQKKQSQRMQAKLIATRAEELREALELLIVIDDFRDIQLVVLDRIEELIQLAESTLPKDNNAPAESLIDIDVEALRERIVTEHEVRTVLKSDREINFAKRQVSRVMSTLNTMAKRKKISTTTLNEYRRYLRVTMLEREVDTFTAQGDLAAQRADVMTASNYYKAARKLLIEFDLQYPEKNDRIRTLSQRTQDLYNGGIKKEDALTKALSREAEVTESDDPHGIPKGEDEKRKY